MSIPTHAGFRTLLTLFAVLATALAGCAEIGPFRVSGDDAVDPDAGVADAPANPDAPRACPVAPTIATVPVGTVASPFAGDFFATASSGPRAGETAFALAAALPGGTATVADLFVLEVYEHTGFQTGSAYPLNPDPTARYTAASHIISDFNFETMASGPRYWASSGSVTFSAIGTATGSAIRGTVSASAYRELDAQQQEVPGGCTTNLIGVTFNLTQQ